MTIALLGRQPQLGLAELESLVGAPNVTPFGPHMALLEGTVAPHRLGSIQRLATPIATLHTVHWSAIAVALKKQLPTIIAALPDGKITLGISAFGVRTTPKQLFATSLELKKICRANKRPARIVPNTTEALNSAQVLHNRLTGPLGIEILIIAHAGKTWLAQTTWVQDIHAYAMRDHGRPHRDAFVGMLPPKLAQTMLNMAQVQQNTRVLDPFCGTGVVLQEALLIGCNVYGTDLQERMVRYSRDNIAWLQQKHTTNASAVFTVADATNAQWQPPIDHVVCETYLGQPLSALPSPEKLRTIMHDCNTIITKFLKNMHSQIAPHTRLCIAVPAWRTEKGFAHLKLLDHIQELGYNRIRFQHAQWDDLLYHREGQIVARELLVLISK